MIPHPCKRIGGMTTPCSFFLFCKAQAQSCLGWRARSRNGSSLLWSCLARSICWSGQAASAPLATLVSEPSRNSQLIDIKLVSVLIYMAITVASCQHVHLRNTPLCELVSTFITIYFLFLANFCHRQ